MTPDLAALLLLALLALVLLRVAWALLSVALVATLLLLLAVSAGHAAAPAPSHSTPNRSLRSCEVRAYPLPDTREVIHSSTLSNPQPSLSAGRPSPASTALPRNSATPPALATAHDNACARNDDSTTNVRARNSLHSLTLETSSLSPALSPPLAAPGGAYRRAAVGGSRGSRPGPATARPTALTKNLYSTSIENFPPGPPSAGSGTVPPTAGPATLTRPHRGDLEPGAVQRPALAHFPALGALRAPGLSAPATRGLIAAGIGRAAPRFGGRVILPVQAAAVEPLQRATARPGLPAGFYPRAPLIAPPARSWGALGVPRAAMPLPSLDGNGIGDRKPSVSPWVQRS